MNISICGFDRTKKEENKLCFDSKLFSYATLEYNTYYIYDGSYDGLRHFIGNSMGKSKREWLNLLYKLSPSFEKSKYSFPKTIDLMIFRSFCIIFRPLYLDFKKDEKEINIDALYDDFYLDWTGKIGIQPSIYFIKKSLYEKEKQLEELYNLQLLFKLNINFQDKIFTTYFIPFNIPITQVNEFSHESYQLFQEIKYDRDLKMDKFFNK